jgi:hypothetical protein
MSTINVIGVVIGRQFIDGDQNHHDWQVSYDKAGRGRYYHAVSSRDAPTPMEAVEMTKRDLGQLD